MPEDARRPRLFVPAAPAFGPGDELALDAGEAHHAAHVLRLRPGAEVEVFDGRGTSAIARITRAGRGDVVVVVEAVRPPAARPRPEVHLAFAVPKGKRLDWLLEKATELGVASLRPVHFARSVAGAGPLSPAARERWRGHCVAAAKQSGLPFLPTIEDALALDAFLPLAPVGLFGDTGDAAAPLACAVAALASAQRFHVVVGPEGGLTDDERRRLAAGGLVPVRLGRTTLRIETAAVALVAAATAILESR